MKISIQDLKTPRQWRSALGCDAHHFAQLLVVFRRAYAALHEMQLAERMVIHPAGTRMKDEEDLLFFTLFSESIKKCGAVAVTKLLTTADGNLDGRLNRLPHTF